MRGAKTPVVIIYSRPHRTDYYESIAAASRATGISEWRLLRGLDDKDGEIPKTRPIVCIDEAVISREDDESC